MNKTIGAFEKPGHTFCNIDFNVYVERYIWRLSKKMRTWACIQLLWYSWEHSKFSFLFTPPFISSLVGARIGQLNDSSPYRFQSCVYKNYCSRDSVYNKYTCQLYLQSEVYTRNSKRNHSYYCIETDGVVCFMMETRGGGGVARVVKWMRRDRRPKQNYKFR